MDSVEKGEVSRRKEAARADMGRVVVDNAESSALWAWRSMVVIISRACCAAHRSKIWVRLREFGVSLSFPADDAVLVVVWRRRTLSLGRAEEEEE